MLFSLFGPWWFLKKHKVNFVAHLGSGVMKNSVSYMIWIDFLTHLLLHFSKLFLNKVEIYSNSPCKLFLNCLYPEIWNNYNYKMQWNTVQGLCIFPFCAWTLALKVLSQRKYIHSSFFKCWIFLNWKFSFIACLKVIFENSIFPWLVASENCVYGLLVGMQVPLLEFLIVSKFLLKIKGTICLYLLLLEYVIKIHWIQFILAHKHHYFFPSAEGGKELTHSLHLLPVL